MSDHRNSAHWTTAAIGRVLQRRATRQQSLTGAPVGASTRGLYNITWDFLAADSGLIFQNFQPPLPPVVSRVLWSPTSSLGSNAYIVIWLSGDLRRETGCNTVSARTSNQYIRNEMLGGFDCQK